MIPHFPFGEYWEPLSQAVQVEIGDGLFRRVIAAAQGTSPPRQRKVERN
ncbi:hypothetical protein BIWAKO_06718 [Bosea sp. BIWAKO-01]|nr:hypothetical protein BIWAKO_06718 [Bosea sp. BIWAKO-01]